MKRHDFIPVARPDLGQEELDAVAEVLRSGMLTTGPKVTEFEQGFAEYLKADEPLFAVGMTSCTAALFLALKVLGVKADDEVIVPTWTFAATAQVVEWLGARPILCDIDADSLNIDPGQAEKNITGKTKALMPVHMAGFPCEMAAIQDLANSYNLRVVEDAAHTIGTEYKSVKIGNFSDITCFSFYATKNLAMGEGGAAVSKDPSLVESMRKLSYFGINKEAFKRYEQTGSWFYDIEALGYKFNLDSLHAAIGLAQLKKIDRMNKRRREIAKRYREGLDPAITFTSDSEEHLHTYHLFPIVLPESIERNVFMKKLAEMNIGSSVHFIPLHRHSHYRKKYEPGRFPVADRIFERVVSIPMYSSLADSDVAYVVENINDIIRNWS